MPNTRKFIKNGRTYNVAFRSQRDPLVADEEAPQRVLIPVAEKQNKGDRKKKQRDNGVDFDDDYDYLQHLKVSEPSSSTVWELTEKPQNRPKTTKQPELPNIVFGSTTQEDIGMLNKAAPRPGPRPDLDPDIVAGLDDDFDYDNPDNQLEDDFMALANPIDEDKKGFNYAEGSDDETNSDDEGNSDDESNYDDEADDDVASLCGSQFTYNDEETKSRFTEYSMSSSVIRRNENLTLLDSRFEKLHESYDDMEIGDANYGGIEGTLTIEQVLARYGGELKKTKESMDQDNEDNVQKKTAKLARLQEESDEEDLMQLEVEDRDQERWDCQSILSTYSNIYNHPTLIQEPKGPKKIKINEKTGLPMNVLGSQDTKLTSKNLAKLNQMSEPVNKTGTRSVAESVVSILSVLSIRPKDETPEEKRERKKLLKEYRQERRLEKKANTEAYKEETRRAQKIRINNRNNVQGNKIM